MFRHFLNHFFPREIIGPVLVVFSLEQVLSAIFQLTIPPKQRTVVWFMIFIISVLVIGYWGAVDDDPVNI